jgi:O-antigen/teichoic acid export membrane protein
MSQAPRTLGRTILHTLATVVIAQGAQIVAGIATARAFGPAGKGIINYMGIFVGFAIASGDGLRNAIAFQIGNEGIAPNVVWRAARALVFVAGLAGCAVFFAAYAHDRSQPAFAFVALAFPFALYLQTVNVLYLVRHAIEKINVQNAWTVGAGSSIVIVVAVAFFHASVLGVLAITLLGYVAAALWAGLGVPRLLAAAGGRTDRGGIAREQLTFGAKGGLSAIVTLLALRIDILIVGSSLSKAALGLYATAVAVAELLLALSRSVTWATTGRIATDTRADAIALTARVVRSLVIGQTLAALGIGLLGPWAIAFFYGNRFAGSATLLALVLPRVVVYSADGVLAYFISVRQGRPGVQFAFELATLAIGALATYLAVGRYGLAGAALAATITFVLAFFGKLVYFIAVSDVGWRAIVVPRADDLPERVRRFLPRAKPPGPS